METAIIAACITAVGGIIAAVIAFLPHFPKFVEWWNGKKPAIPAINGVSHTPRPELEERLRSDPQVGRLLRNRNWATAATAAIAYYCHGTESATFNNTRTWKQVGEVFNRLQTENEVLAENGRAAMDWEQLLAALQRSLVPGQITTYGECSQWAYQHRRGSPSIVAMLNAIARRGHHVWSNRVVQDDGGIADPADAGYGQRAQLEAEGVPFTPLGRVDLALCPPQALH